MSIEDDTQLIEAALEGPLKPIAGRVRAEVRPSWRLRRSASGGRTRLGGEPALPAATAWPTFTDRPLGFLAQIDSADVPDPASNRRLLPAGLWSFFYDIEDPPWGFDPADRGRARVLHTPPDVETQPRTLPAGIDRELLYPPSGLSFSAELTLPYPESLAGEKLGLDDRGPLYAAYFNLVEALAERHDREKDEPRHRLFGHADQIQGDMQFECQLVTHGLYCGDPSGYTHPRAAELWPGSAEWQLLLQLDSEFDPAEVMWGDVGRVYFWIRNSDLAARRADAAWAILQCS